MNRTALRLTAISIAVLATGCASITRDRTSTETAPTPVADSAPRALAAQDEVPLVGPQNARPGECYARVFNPARYEQRTEQVLKAPAGVRVDGTPAQTEEVEEQVLVKAATTRIEVVPAVYETVEEDVVVEPARTVIEPVPAQYVTVTERVLVKPAVWAWKKASEGASSSVRRINENGEVLCLVETPAQYDNVTRERVKTPATTRERQIEAVTRKVQRQILKTPATTREVEVPAEYQTVKVQRVITPARQQTVEVPAEYDTLQRTVLASPAHEEWRQVLCSVNATPDNVRALQDALRTAGYDPGPTTGRIDAPTLRALRNYQAARDLPVDQGEYVNVATVQALGVDAAPAPSAASGEAPAIQQ